MLRFYFHFTPRRIRLGHYQDRDWDSRKGSSDGEQRVGLPSPVELRMGSRSQDPLSLDFR